jgi:hypothetical protein
MKGKNSLWLYKHRVAAKIFFQKKESWNHLSSKIWLELRFEDLELRQKSADLMRLKTWKRLALTSLLKKRHVESQFA